MDIKSVHIAKLVLGYLKLEKCQTAYDEFLKNSNDLLEFQKDDGLKHIVTRFWGKTLKGILLDYANVYTIVQEHLDDTDYYNNETYSTKLAKQLLYLLDNKCQPLNPTLSSTWSSSPSNSANKHSFNEDISVIVEEESHDINSTAMKSLPVNSFSVTTTGNEAPPVIKCNQTSSEVKGTNRKCDMVVPEEVVEMMDSENIIADPVIQVLTQTILEPEDLQEKVAITSNNLQPNESVKVEKPLETLPIRNKKPETNAPLKVTKVDILKQIKEVSIKKRGTIRHHDTTLPPTDDLEDGEIISECDEEKKSVNCVRKSSTSKKRELKRQARFASNENGVLKNSHSFDADLLRCKRLKHNKYKSEMLAPIEKERAAIIGNNMVVSEKNGCDLKDTANLLDEANLLNEQSTFSKEESGISKLKSNEVKEKLRQPPTITRNELQPIVRPRNVTSFNVCDIEFDVRIYEHEDKIVYHDVNHTNKIKPIHNLHERCLRAAVFVEELQKEVEKILQVTPYTTILDIPEKVAPFAVRHNHRRTSDQHGRYRDIKRDLVIIKD